MIKVSLSYLLILIIFGYVHSQPKIKGLQLHLSKEVPIDFQFEKNYYRTISQVINDSLFVINPQDHSLSNYLLFYNTYNGKLFETI